MRNLRTITVALLFGLGCFAALGFAQATDGNLIGAVQDASGAVVPNAAVTLENLGTGVKYSAKTDSGGLYHFLNVPVGNYKVSAKASGFSDAAVGGVKVELNRTTTINLNLQVGAVATTVEVTEAAPAIDTATAQLSANFENTHAKEIAMASVGSGVLNLSLLSAGVASSGGIGAGSGPSVGGQRPRNNSFNIEGVDNNNKSVTGPLVSLPGDSVANFSVLQNQFAAEFGHSSGAQFNTIVKSGTNQVHGSIYDYLQNRNLNAIDVAFGRQGFKENPRYDQNRLGAAIGGPIKKNKLFYFGNFEYNPVGRATTPAEPVFAPTAAGYTTLSGIAGVSATNIGILKQYLPPVSTAVTSTKVKGVTIPLGIFPIAAPNYTNSYFSVLSMDYNLSDRDQLKGRYIYNKISAIDNAPQLPAFYLGQPNTYYLATISEYHTFSPRVVNEFRLGYNRYNQTFSAGDFKFPGLDQFPNITIEEDLAVQLGPDPNAPQFTIQNTYQLVDNLSWNRGNHALKFGFDGRKVISPGSFTQRARGDYNYSTLEQYALDLTPDVLGERSLGNVVYYGDQIQTYWYVNDIWKVRPNISLNLGLRHEYTTIPFGERAQKLNAISNVPDVLTFYEPQPQKANFQPRVGLAYSPGKSGNTSFRAGFGMGHDVLYDNIGILSLPPEFGSTTIDADITSNAPNFLKNGGIKPTSQGGGAACVGAADCRAATTSFIPHQKLAYSIQWNFGVQRVFRKDYTLEVRYLGTRGVHLDTQSRLNRITNVTASQSLPTYLQAPTQAQLDALPLTLNALQALSSNKWSRFGFTGNVVSFEPRGNSIYHGLATELKRRFSHGLTGQLSYTWSHAIDDSTADFFSTLISPRRPQDFQNMRAERSSSALDRRHRLTISSIYEAPWMKSSSNWLQKNLLGNWTFSGVYIKESPEYGVVQSGIDSNLNGDSAGDRSILNPSGTAGTGSDVRALTNTAGRTVAYLALNPNAQYIKAGVGAFATAGRNTLPLRGINNFDLSFNKKFNIRGERWKFEFKADFINAFNHPQFVPGAINDVLSIGRTNTRNYLIPGNKDFNNPESAFGSNPRTIQLVARITF